jgi:hypothetical protein
MTLTRLATAAALTLSPLASALAGPYDGSQALICAPSEILECERSLQCEAQSAETVDLPAFIRISVADKTVTGTRPSGEPVDAKITTAQLNDQQLFLQGVQKRFGWSAAIDQTKGHLTMTIHDQASGFVIFGACTPR